MATQEVKLGLGLSTGMFYHAAAGTALPTYPSVTLDSAWTKVGDVTSDGITLAQNKSVTNLRNWANEIKRALLTEHSETIQSPIMDTTEETLKTVMGSANVTVTASSASHGKKCVVNLSAGDLPPAEAYLWIMKDGDDMIAIGCTKGQITAVDNVSFQPGSGITWTPTITAMGSTGFQLIMEEGVTGSTGA